MPSITVPVREVTHATPRTRIIALDLTNTDLPFNAGQAAMIGIHGSALKKPYSIASAPSEVSKLGLMQVLVQIDESGALDPHLELAAPGTNLDVDGPFGSFGLPESSGDPILMVAGGTGIAPLRSILMQELSYGAPSRIALVYSARSADEFAFRSELDALQQQGRLTAYFTVTRDAGAWTGRRGRIDGALLREALPSTTAQCLVCGPPALVTDATALLRSFGIPADRIRVEKY